MGFRFSVFFLLVLGLGTLGILALDPSGQLRGARTGADTSFCSTAPAECAQLFYAPESTAREKLAATYAPIVYLPDLDQPCRRGGSSFSPLPVETVLDNGAVSLRKVSEPGFVKWAPSGADLWLIGGDRYFDAYIDLPGDPNNPGCRYERDGLRFAGEQEHIAYARVVPDEESGGLFLQYWLFYYFNDWNNQHEGDWELIQLRFEASSADEALMQEPSTIALSQHRSGEVAAWSDAKLRRHGSRPIVYVARGSHANYFGPGLYLGRGEDGRGMGCDDASKSGRSVPLGVTLLPESPGGPRDRFAWLAFKGYWGEVKGQSSEGSTAPATKQTWLRPARWQEGLQGTSVSLPYRSSIGPDAARAFCNVVGFGSEFLLPLYRDIPMVSALVLATVSASVLGSLATIRFMPVRPRPLRSARRLGQAFTAAVAVYRRQWCVFVSIGLLVFPLGIIASGVYALTDGLGWLNPQASLPFGAIGRQAGWTLALSGIQVGLATLVVLVVTVMTVASLDRAERAGEQPSFSGLLRLLPAALLARLLAAIAVGALCLTVIGIPLAIRQAVRWAFVDQAVLLDGVSWRAAFAASSVAAGRDEYRVTAGLVLLGLLSVVLVPAVGIGLLLTVKSIPLVYLNLATSALYALLVPYVAIAVSLLYFDLQERATASKE